MTDTQASSTRASSPAPYRVADWLPSDHAHLTAWLQEHTAAAAAAAISAKAQGLPEYLPVVQEFKDLIESDGEIFMLFNQMFDQVPRSGRYVDDPAGNRQIRDYHQMLQNLNYILTHTPTFNTTGVVGFPINAILDWSMGTEGGFAAFLNDKVNAQLKKILNEWGTFLKSPDSAYAINEDPTSGWLGAEALVAMVKMLPAVPGSGGTPYWEQDVTPERARQVFIETFECDPSADHWGFQAWDDFFLRDFRDGQRPIASPDDDSVIVSACESAPYNMVTGVKLRDRFWIKGQPYSLAHMLNDDPLVDHFVGGTIYQAFLSAKSYHRWHSPVSGTIRKAYVQDGTYYSEIPSYGFFNPLHPDAGDEHPDDAGPNDSQGYISEVATRAMIFIEADNADIGLMCFLPIGMAEVSSCDISVYDGQHVEKGDPIGQFHFGGSSHCLIFGPHVQLDFEGFHGQTPSLNTNNIAVNDFLARATRKAT